MSAQQIQTVLGPIPISSLGRTLMHEHVFTFHADIRGDYPWVDEVSAIDGAVVKLRRLSDAGFETIVDLTVFGLGRNVARVAAVAATADFNVIAATGIYVGSELPVYFAHRQSMDPHFLEELFVHEIEEGIADTGIRPALLKCVTDHHGLTRDVDLILRSVARAHLRTGAPISTHTDAATQSGLLQQSVFREEGVDLRRVIIGHCGDTTDIAYLQEILDAGSYIGMDRFGLSRWLDLPERIATVAALCRKGYAAQMLLSHDTNCGGDLPLPEPMRNFGYTLIAEHVVPALRESGVTDGDIDLMTIENPARIFATAAADAARRTS